MFRANNLGNTTSTTGSANGKGRAIVPIFANKKKRLKQALYSNPNMDDFAVNDEGLEEIESLEKSLYPEEPGYFGAQSFGKDSLCQPSFRKSNPSTKEFQHIKHEGHPNHLTSPYGKTLSAMDRNDRYGKENVHSVGGKPKLIPPPKEICTPPKQLISNRRVNVKAPVKRPPQPRDQQFPLLPPPRGNQQKAKKNLASKFDVGAMGNSNSELGSNRPNQHQTIPSSKTRSRQINMMTTEQNNSLLFMTASIDSLHKWTQYRDQFSLIFEVFGILDSQVSMNANGNGKNFVVKDKTGLLRCTFWEMDRALPKLSRGQMVRCVGKLDRITQVFHCVSVRLSQPSEQALVAASKAASDRTLKDIV